MINVVSVSKKFGSKTALSAVNIDCRSGIVTGVVGANGAGKTTLFRCMAGLISHSGEVKFEPDKNQYHIGYLPTNPDMLTLVTGEEYLRLMCNARGVEKFDVKSNNIFDLPLNEYAENYSTGMKKKLTLTGILMQRNEVFLLDEPFSGVDIQSNLLIVEVIDRLKSLGKTIVMSSHIFSALHEVCDVLYYLSEGSIQDHAEKADFHRIETSMKSTDVTDRVNQLDLE